MLCSLNDNAYLPPGYADQLLPDGNIAQGFWRLEDNLVGMQAIPRGHAAAATTARNRFAQWFSEEGANEGQDNHINRIQ